MGQADLPVRCQSSGRSPLGAIFTSFGSNWPGVVTRSLCFAKRNAQSEKILGVIAKAEKPGRGFNHDPAERL